MFAINPSGSWQGAIEKPDDNFSAPAGSIPRVVTCPTRPGDEIVIFASVLGPVSPALPRGLISDRTGTSVPQLLNFPTVRLDDQPTIVEFAGLTQGFVEL